MQQAVAMAVAGRDQLIGVRAMAELTGQAPSTVSRYVKRHEELGVVVDGQTKVWRDKYLAHKADNIDAQPPIVEDDEEPRPAPVLASREAAPARHAKARHEEVRAELAEIELAEKKGELVRAADVQAAIATAAQALRDTLLTNDIEFAERLLAAKDPLAAAAMIADRNRAALQDLVAALMGEGG